MAAMIPSSSRRCGLLLGAVAALNGCFLFSSTAASTAGDVPDELKVWTPHIPDVADRHAGGAIEGLKPGQWVRYLVKRPSGDIRLAIGVLSIETDRAWIEWVEEGESRLASARLVSKEGRVLKALFREIGPRGTSTVYEQKIVQSSDDDAPVPSEETTEKRELDLLGTKQNVVVVRLVFRDEVLGRSETDETTWCAALPGLYASGPHGGLVRRTRERLSVEILESGTDYKPVIPEAK